MPKITRHKLTRGTKLTTQSVFSPISSAATAMSTAAVDTDNLKQSFGTFRVNIHVPNVPQIWWSDHSANSGKIHLCIPFALPPLQDEFTRTGLVSEITSIPTLVEFGIGFDQRGEAAAVETGAAAKLNYGAVEHLDLRLSLVEKKMMAVDSGAGMAPEREIVSLRLPPTAFSGRGFRLNPFTMTGLNEQMHPYRSYMIMFDGEKLKSAGAATVDLPSLAISLKFRIPLTARDNVSSDGLQNAPTAHNGAKTTQAISITTPAGDSLVLADGAGGINTEMGKIDNALLNRLEGGYLADGDAPPAEHLADDSCYDIIAIPMFSNVGNNGILQAANVADMPWKSVTGVANRGPLLDIRRFPISYPFVVHHVIGVANYAAPPLSAGGAAGRHPAAATNATTVGVLIGTGARGDLFNYQQVAYATWTPANKNNYVIDRLTNKDDGLLGQHSTGEEWDYELMQIPLVAAGAATGVSFNNVSGGSISQGKPVFIGRGNTKTSARTQIGNHLNAAQAPSTRGIEQFVEVRWRIQDTADMSAPATGAQTTYAGIGGHWVFLVCRKTLSADVEEINPASR